MKLSIAFIVVIVAALVAPSQQADLVDQPPLRSSLKIIIIGVLDLVNKILNHAETVFDEYLRKLFPNSNQAEQLFVNIQNNAAKKAVEHFFVFFDALRHSIEATAPVSLQTLLLKCVSEEESQVLAIVHNATTSNGWCNVRMIPSVTGALFETSSALISVNAEFKSLATSLKTCTLEDEICLLDYIEKVTDIFGTQISGEADTISAALKEFFRTSKIMFNEDIPTCAKKHLLPSLLSGLGESVNEVFQCAFVV